MYKQINIFNKVTLNPKLLLNIRECTNKDDYMCIYKIFNIVKLNHKSVFKYDRIISILLRLLQNRAQFEGL